MKPLIRFFSSEQVKHISITEFRKAKNKYHNMALNGTPIIVTRRGKFIFALAVEPEQPSRSGTESKPD